MVREKPAMVIGLEKIERIRTLEKPSSYKGGEE
jgi:hypothetical protein